MGIGNEEEEDFSFPIFINTENQATAAAAAVSSIDSPPLWHLSPVASPVHSSNKKQEEEEEENCLSEAKPENYNDEDDDEEEKMDILWEDFNMNEELSSNTIYSSGGDLKLSKNYNNTSNGALFTCRKPKLGILVFIKILKKFALLRNSHHYHHHHRHHHPYVQKNRPL